MEGRKEAEFNMGKGNPFPPWVSRFGPFDKRETLILS